MIKKEKTDWYFVTTLVCIAILGLTIVYIGKIVGLNYERIEYLEMEHVRSINQNLPLPVRCEEGAVKSTLEYLGIEKPTTKDE